MIDFNNSDYNKLDGITKKYVDFIVQIGATGATGPQGDIGPTGATGLPGTYSITSTTASTTLSSDVLLVDTSITGITVSLPTAIGIGGEIRTIKDKTGDANINNIILDAFGTETIDTLSTYNIRIRYESATLLSDGSNWWLV